MRKFALFLSVSFLFALAAAVEASVQTEPMELRPLCPPLDSSDGTGIVPVGDGEFGSRAAFCSFEMPRLMIDACVGCVGLAPRGRITLCDLAEAARSQRQTLPEPSTIAVWSLIGLCWSGVRCWRRRRGLVQSGLGWDRPRTQRRTSRPPWPDHVRARILEIIERGAPR
jgi:hypothetical protein